MAADMPFLDHLEELRQRLLKVVVALGVAMAFSLALVMKFDAITFLTKPIVPYLPGGKLVFTHPADSFTIALTVSLGLALVIAAPVILYQVWAFMAPALYQNEKKIVIPLLVAASLLFATGVSGSFFLVLPFTLRFLMQFQSAALIPMITASDYFSFATTMSLALGAVFELPIVLTGLTALGIVTPELLRRYRRHALVAAVITSSLITPGDAVSATLVLLGPLYGLYEISIVASALVYRRKQRRILAEQAADLGAPA
jgi:sec-independent protein translocase protein TatC